MKKVLFTSESVTEGHPDKICDQISDAVLDEILKVDPVARVACETLTTTGIVMVVGEITTSEYVDIQSIVRNVLKDIGYTRAKYGFDASTCSVVTSINEQSRDIALGVDSALEYKKGNEDKYNSVGAGDQGMMFGYACTETEEFMPLPITLAHNLSKRLSYVRKNDILMCSRNGSERLVGKTAIINTTEKMYFGAFMMLIRSKYFEFLQQYFQTEHFRSTVKQGATTTINQITVKMMDKVKVPLPPLTLQNQFADFVAGVDKSQLAGQMVLKLWRKLLKFSIIKLSFYEK